MRSIESVDDELIDRARKPFANGDDGTFPLGVPTGTHEYYLLVMRGPNADEVSIDAVTEGGTVTRAEPPKFVDLTLAYF